MRPVVASEPALAKSGRILAALLLAALAVFVARQGFAAAMRKAQPELALALAPFDSRSLSLVAERVLARRQDEAARARASRLARKALARDPTNVTAVTMIGFVAALEAKPDQARRLFDQAQRLSRRDLRTQIWFIEDAVGRGDVTSALRQYDTALRTSRVGREMLFPVLSTAIGEPQVRAAAAAVLRGRPPWADAFLYHAATLGPDPAALSDLVDRARHPLSPETHAELIRRLVVAERFDLAWGRYAAKRPGASRAAVRAGDFRQGQAVVTQFDWNAAAESGLSATLPDERASGLDVQATPGAGGLAVSQLQLLDPGRYRFIGRMRGLAGTVGEKPYWALSCVTGSKAQLGRVALTASDERAADFGGAFVVPAGCPAQSLQLIVPATDDIGGIALTVERVALSPADA